MVYCGKPSRGCENCRKLHKKCDEKRPACSRCLRTDKICRYRNQDLMFRDETTRTQDKFRQWHLRNCGSDSRSVRNASRFPALAPASIYGSCLTPAYRLSPSAEDAVICYFYQTTTETMSDQDPAHYLHKQLPNLYARSVPGSPFRLATEAISYAISTRLVQDAALLSRKRYIQAAKAIRKAIQDPTEARDDQTLYAILLLCGYETIVQDPNTPPAWGAHVDGAAALVRFRNTSQVHSPLSRSMFCFIRKSVVLGHMQLCRPVDEIFTVPDYGASLYESPEDHLIATAAKIPNLQYRSKHLLTQPRDASENDAESLFCSARALDRELSDWATRISTTWSYSAAMNIRGSTCSNFTSRQVHRYPSFYTARVWNFYRVSRLIVQSVLLRSISWLPVSIETRPNELDKSRIEEISMKLINDICASVPFLLGHNLSNMKLPATREQGRTSCHEVKENGTRHTGRFSLIWPLYVACSAPAVPEAQREWMQMQLQFLAEHGESLAQFVCFTKSQILLGRDESFRFDCV